MECYKHFFSELPIEILLLIFSFCDGYSIFQMQYIIKPLIFKRLIDYDKYILMINDPKILIKIKEYFSTNILFTNIRFGKNILLNYLATNKIFDKYLHGNSYTFIFSNKEQINIFFKLLINNLENYSKRTLLEIAIYHKNFNIYITFLNLLGYSINLPEFKIEKEMILSKIIRPLVFNPNDKIDITIDDINTIINELNNIGNVDLHIYNIKILENILKILGCEYLLKQLNDKLNNKKRNRYLMILKILGLIIIIILSSICLLFTIISFIPKNINYNLKNKYIENFQVANGDHIWWIDYSKNMYYKNNSYVPEPMNTYILYYDNKYYNDLFTNNCNITYSNDYYIYYQRFYCDPDKYVYLVYKPQINAICNNIQGFRYDNLCDGKIAYINYTYSIKLDFIKQNAGCRDHYVWPDLHITDNYYLNITGIRCNPDVIKYDIQNYLFYIPLSKMFLILGMLIMFFMFFIFALCVYLIDTDDKIIKHRKFTLDITDDN